ncbi:MAG: class I SAM-dependent methyltransferase [Clostridia bacterium]|nr:class I SAM-dependent methyltransferase [Clostridia bacterium]
MNALTYVHETIKRHIGKGAVCIDATAGRGYDTAFLCELVGDSGRVIAFDIQQEAIDSTRKLLHERGLSAEVILSSHANMAEYAAPESVDCIVFNLGYLPRGDHSVYTHFESTRTAIESGLNLLKRGGLMCVSVYYGGDSGYEEKDALLPWLKELDDSKYQVLATFFYNWKKDPPIPIFIYKL